jgi:hypothetical protein
MALVKCRECGHEVSDQAEACPHCGIKNPGQPTGVTPQADEKPSRVQTPKKKGNGCLTVIGVFFVIIVVVVAIGNNTGSSSSTNGPISSTPQSSSPSSGNVPPSHPPPPAPTCSTDWRACKDNADLVNNSLRWGDVQAACQTAVDNDVQYGEPKWPGFMSGGAFGSFFNGNDYVSTGKVIAIEPNVQIENGFGAMVHSTVHCQYDLNSKTVLGVSINPN